MNEIGYLNNRALLLTIELNIRFIFFNEIFAFQLIPANGMERWFPLEGREKSKMKDRGEIRLSLSLSASNETTYSQQENFIHYERIVRIFAEHHFRSDPVRCSFEKD